MVVVNSLFQGLSEAFTSSLYDPGYVDKGNKPCLRPGNAQGRASSQDYILHNI